jgi:hypothetical protein
MCCNFADLSMKYFARIDSISRLVILYISQFVANWQMSSAGRPILCFSPRKLSHEAGSGNLLQHKRKCCQLKVWRHVQPYVSLILSSSAQWLVFHCSSVRGRSGNLRTRHGEVDAIQLRSVALGAHASTQQGPNMPPALILAVDNERHLVHGRHGVAKFLYSGR